MDENVSVHCEILAETDMAFLVTDNAEDKVWLPKSKVEIKEIWSIGDCVEIEMPQWLAESSGLI